jgi:hypothetical protein
MYLQRVALAIANEGLGDCHALLAQNFWPAANTATGSCRLQAGNRSLANDTSLKLGQRGKGMKDQLARRRSRIDRFRQRFETATIGLQQFDRENQLRQLANRSNFQTTSVSQGRYNRAPLSAEADQPALQRQLRLIFEYSQQPLRRQFAVTGSDQRLKRGRIR